MRTVPLILFGIITAVFLLSYPGWTAPRTSMPVEGIGFHSATGTEAALLAKGGKPGYQRNKMYRKKVKPDPAHPPIDDKRFDHESKIEPKSLSDSESESGSESEQQSESEREPESEQDPEFKQGSSSSPVKVVLDGKVRGDWTSPEVRSFCVSFSKDIRKCTTEGKLTLESIETSSRLFFTAYGIWANPKRQSCNVSTEGKLPNPSKDGNVINLTLEFGGAKERCP